MSTMSDRDRLICGLKLTHDGAIAVIDGGHLLFSIEAEKIANAPRYSDLSSVDRVASLLAARAIDLADVGAISVDGWVRFGDGKPVIDVTNHGRRRAVPVAGYSEVSDHRFQRDPYGHIEGHLELGTVEVPFRSYLHATNHVFAGYCTSPFAVAGRGSFVLVWDGGMPACLYHFDPSTRSLLAIGPVLGVSGSIYPIFASYLSPFRLQPGASSEALLPIAGKAMAYAGLGTISEPVIEVMSNAADRYTNLGRRQCYQWSSEVISDPKVEGVDEPSLIASLQEFLLRRLLAGLRRTSDGASLPLCFVGGCALNIKWNTALRRSGLFDGVWVPPFPNDSGSAIGAACTEMVRSDGPTALEWDVFSGPALNPPTPALAGWRRDAATLEDVGRLLHELGEPIVLLSGLAEVGPRALGHRSIIAPAVDRRMRDHLNAVKGREPFRPVAPICLEERAPDIFEPGTPDPYMLFDHTVRASWRGRIPAVVHVDSSARLQTVGPDNPTLRRLLLAYEACSGIPVLCNTSANGSGRGFFPDAVSAMEWAGVARVWADGSLYTAIR